ncbi:hypothetical protein [Virgibacillus doumboii]|uniref:hypothetical protein n=1 Tax=Virgibacillus doumboii TaxID=2697503 RepID=UPI0013DF16DD|nr:hypothetical protein [Virgibacillus doumboii]
MEKKIEGHLAGFGELKYWSDYEQYIFDDEGMIREKYSGYADTPSKDECDQICAKLSSKVKIVYTDVTE